MSVANAVAKSLLEKGRGSPQLTSPWQGSLLPHLDLQSVGWAGSLTLPGPQTMNPSMGISYHMEMLAALVFQDILSVYHPAGGMQLWLLTTPHTHTILRSLVNDRQLASESVLPSVSGLELSQPRIILRKGGSSPGRSRQGSFSVHFPA